MKLYIGENIRRLRAEMGLTQEMLAKRLGVSFQTVSHWETGQTYPDIEMIPEVASFFEVTTDELMGVEKAVLEKRIIEDWNIVNNIQDLREKIEKFREMRRLYPRESAVLKMMIINMAYFPEYHDEIRELSEEYLSMPGIYASDKYDIISTLINCESEENLPSLLDKYATPHPVDRSCFLASRSNFRKDYDGEKKYLQYNSLMTIHSLEHVFVRYGESWRRILELYNWYTHTEGMSLVAGDGVPDLWYSGRHVAGFRYAEECIAAGRIDEGFIHLEDAVTLYESMYSLPAGTVLTFRCKELSELKVTLREGVCRSFLFNDLTKERYKCFFSEEEDFGTDLKIQFDAMRSTYNPFHHYCSQYDMFPLVSKFGWHGFDSVRDDPRFKDLVERMKKFVILINE